MLVLYDIGLQGLQFSSKGNQGRQAHLGARPNETARAAQGTWGPCQGLAWEHSVSG